MVDISATVTIIDAAFVQLPRFSSSANGDGADSCDCVHEGSVVVLGEALVASDADHGLFLGLVALCVRSHVGVHLLEGETLGEGVVERQPLGGAFAATGTTAVIGVGSA
mgnify:CR=1 FL=1